MLITRSVPTNTISTNGRTGCFVPHCTLVELIFFCFMTHSKQYTPTIMPLSSTSQWKFFFPLRHIANCMVSTILSPLFRSRLCTVLNILFHFLHFVVFFFIFRLYSLTVLPYVHCTCSLVMVAKIKCMHNDCLLLGNGQQNQKYSILFLPRAPSYHAVGKPLLSSLQHHVIHL